MVLCIVSESSERLDRSVIQQPGSLTSVDDLSSWAFVVPKINHNEGETAENRIQTFPDSVALVRHRCAVLSTASSSTSFLLSFRSTITATHTKQFSKLHYFFDRDELLPETSSFPLLFFLSRISGSKTYGSVRPYPINLIICLRQMRHRAASHPKWFVKLCAAFICCKIAEA